MPVTPTPSQYATATDIQRLALTPAAYARFEAGAAGSVVAALQGSSGEADSYLASQFVLPILTWDMALVRAVCWMAAKYLYDQFGYNPGAPVDKLIEDRYKLAIAWLDKISNKKLFPQYVDSSTGTTDAGPWVISQPPVGFTTRGCQRSECDRFELDPLGGLF